MWPKGVGAGLSEANIDDGGVAWQATGYVLYSAGSRVAANGTQTPPITVTSGLMLATQTAEMVDNLYANAP